MSGKWVGIIVLVCAALAGAGLYYLQVFGYYQRVPAASQPPITLTPIDGTPPEILPVTAFEAIDANSSPIRFRACFETDQTIEELSARYIRMDHADPRNAPFWFSCFDAKTLGPAITAGEVAVFLGTKNHAYGVDRLVAIDTEGRGWVWHELNGCGEKAYDGTVTGETCPER